MIVLVDDIRCLAETELSIECRGRPPDHSLGKIRALAEQVLDVGWWLILKQRIEHGLGPEVASAGPV